MSEKRQFVSSLRDGDAVADVFAVVQATVREYQPGKTKIDFCLADKTGTINAVRWSPARHEQEDAARLRYAFARGKVGDYKGKAQVALPDGLVSVPDPSDLSLYLLSSPFSLDDLKRRFLAHRRSVKDVALSALLDAVFGDVRLWERFEIFPAAKSNHHAFRHGLLQHTIEVADHAAAMVAADRFSDNGVSYDLTVTGALLHDIGKIEELEPDGCGYDFSVAGNLNGHVLLGRDMVLIRICRLGKTFPPLLRHSLLHILASHHGKCEFGAPVTPRSAEALIVHYADDLSVKLWAMNEARRQAAEGAEWSSHPCLQESAQLSPRKLYVGPSGSLNPDAEPLVTAPSPAPVRSTREKRVEWSLTCPWNKTGGAPDGQIFAVVRVNVLGRIAAGVPLLAEEDSNEQIEVEGAFGAGPFFALRVSGDSMIDDGIEDGDVLIARQQDAPDEGDIVVAEIAGGATSARDGATVKRYGLAPSGQPVLFPSNAAYAPIELEPGETLRIRGVAVGVARRSPV